jgi:hypothetical protein
VIAHLEKHRNCRRDGHDNADGNNQIDNHVLPVPAPPAGQFPARN